MAFIRWKIALIVKVGIIANLYFEDKGANPF